MDKIILEGTKEKFIEHLAELLLLTGCFNENLSEHIAEKMINSLILIFKK